MAKNQSTNGQQSSLILVLDLINNYKKCVQRLDQPQHSLKQESATYHHS